MNKIICHTHYLPKGIQQELSFLELLLDERWSKGELEYPDDIFSLIGNRNTKLSVKQEYEFLLRAAQKYPVLAIGCQGEDNVSLSAEQAVEDSWESFRTDCYIVGKYQQELLDSEYFNPVVEALLTAAARLPQQDTAIEWLEKMISQSSEYHEIDDDTAPILIYLGTDICCNTLNLFALELAEGFTLCGQRVELFDVEKEGNQALTQYIGRRFKAIIGIQTYVFSIMMQDQTTNLHDLIHGPKFNLVLDHPAWLNHHMAHIPKDYCLLIHDRNYVAFAKKYYKNLKDSFWFPPGGALPSLTAPSKKEFDLSFIGSYHDYRDRLKVIAGFPRKNRFLAARFITIMKQYPDLPAETAFQQALDFYQYKLSEKEFFHLFFDMRQCSFVIMLYYREKIIKTLLDAGIPIHVFSETWEQAPYAGHPCLHCHGEVDVKKSLHIMQQSKLSLNIMSWHKDGLTERVLNALLCESVVVSDKSSTLEEDFVDGQDLVLFDLKRLEALPGLIQDLLADDERLQQIAANGCHKAKQKHLWTHRASQLLDRIEATQKV